MKKIFFFLCVWLCVSAKAQELYPYAEPASNMPSHSISIKNTSVFQNDIYSGRTVQRHMPELMFGLNRD